MTQLQILREELDKLDTDMVALFERRMEISKRVAAYKKAHGLSVLDTSREAEVLSNRAEMLNDKSLAPYLYDFYKHLMAQSRQLQSLVLKKEEPHA